MRKKFATLPFMDGRERFFPLSWQVRPHRGLTLLELLVVISIMALLFSLGLSQIASLRKAHRLEAEALAIRSLIRSARSHAKKGLGEAIVEVDLKNRKIRALGSETLLYFPFEKKHLQQQAKSTYLIQGLGPYGGQFQGIGIKKTAGFFGQGIALGGKNSRIEIPSSLFRRALTEHGLYLSLWLRVDHEQLDNRQYTLSSFLLFSQNKFYVSLLEGGAVEVGLKHSYGSSRWRTRGGVYPLRQWFSLRVFLYREQIRLWVSSIPCDLIPLFSPSRDSKFPQGPFQESLWIGGGEMILAIDEVTIAVLRELSLRTYPKNFHLSIKGLLPKERPHTLWIVFNSRGELSPFYHPQQVTLTLRGAKEEMSLWIAPTGIVYTEEPRRLTPTKKPVQQKQKTSQKK